MPPKTIMAKKINGGNPYVINYFSVSMIISGTSGGLPVVVGYTYWYSN